MFARQAANRKHPFFCIVPLAQTQARAAAFSGFSLAQHAAQECGAHGQHQPD
jgi:hypothetical protein